MIRKVKDKYVLYSKDGTKKLFSSTSYAAVVNRERQIQYFKAKAAGKAK